MGITTIVNIGCLVNTRTATTGPLKGAASSALPVLQNAFLEITGQLITGYGVMQQYVPQPHHAIVDAKGGYVWPGWCDSHTHLVFAGSWVS